MRLLPVLLLLPLLAFPAHAQTAPPQPAVPTAGAAAPTPTPGALAKTKPKHHRMTWQERFAQANVSHDGHLTLQQAKGGDPAVARHFTEIDADKKGFVTEEDVANWHKLQRATRHSRKSPAEKGLQPQHAFLQGSSPARRFNTSTTTQVMPMTQPDAQADGQQATTK